MYTPWTSYVIILILNTLACVIIAFLLARKRFAVGQLAMILTFLSLAFWIFGYAMLLTSTTVEWKVFWLRVENIGIIPQSLFWFIFALQYSNQNKNAPIRLIAVLSIAPTLALTFIFSDRWIHLYYPLIERLYPNGGPLKLERGTAYWVMLAQVYLLELAALILLLRRFIGHRNIYRKQMGLLITAVVFPWVANLYFQLAPHLPLPAALTTPLDVTPLAFALSAALISAAIFGLKLFDLIPIARYRVLEHIPQMVFVVDAEDRVLDINDMGQKWLGKSAEQLIGNFATDVFDKWSELVNRHHNQTESHEEINIPGDPSRTLEVAIFPVYNRNKLEGRVFVAHDITNRIKLEGELKKTNETLRAKIVEAIRDPLTGAYNRRFLSDFLDSELAQASKTATPVSVVILDVDHFKKFNDMHGHKCGDIVLQTLAKLLVNDSRRGDIVCRYGGEEFIVVVLNSSLESAYECAEKWRKNFASTLIEFNGQLLSTTFSAGVACFPIHGSTGEDILHAADHALYQSKSKGRNQVNVF